MGPRGAGETGATRRASLQPLPGEPEALEMSVKAPSVVKRSKWLDWRPKGSTPSDSVGDKSPGPGSEGFAAAGTGESSEIDAERSGADRHPGAYVPDVRTLEN